MTTFPIKVKMNKGHLAEFRESELGRWEDQSGGPYAYEILDRHKTVVEIKSQEELKEIYWSLCTGTFQLTGATRGVDDEHERLCDRWHKAANKLADVLQPHVADYETARLRPEGL